MLEIKLPECIVLVIQTRSSQIFVGSRLSPSHASYRWSRAAAAEKVALEQELSQSKSAQAELDTTADAFRRLQKERQETVAQWEQTLATVSRF